MGFKEKLAQKSGEVESFLSSCLNSIEMPQSLRTAMNYSLLAGGKRLRPVLCLVGAALFDSKLVGSGAVMPFAVAIECIHTYSLIHDDLPAMDDDDLRRGKPSSHKAFGEATAILAGDALLTDAFVFMTRAGLDGGIPAERVLKAINTLALAVGSSGMVGGQFLDMEYTAKSDKTLEELKAMQAAKTGAFITASCLCGAILAGADEARLRKVAAYGRNLGAAFQIVDDILDETGDEAVLGKPVGSDTEQGKVTYPTLVGLEQSRKLADEAGQAALDSLGGFEGSVAVFLRELVEYVLKRAS